MAPTDSSGADECDADTRRSGTEERAFFQVDGMHCATCEAFLESNAEDCAGVTDAAASYVTETVRVEYDPSTVSANALCDALSPLGYTAAIRDGGSDRAPSVVGRSRRQDQIGGRDIDELLGFRYAVGVIFGTFMLLPYAALLYPAQLSSFFGDGTLDIFAGASGIGGGDGLLILPLFLVLTGVVLVFTGLPLLQGAYVSLKMRQPNTDLLVALSVVSAYVYSTIAFLLGRIDVYYDLTIVIAASVVAAIFYESLSKQRAMDRLTDLTISRVTDARRYDADGTTTVDVSDLEPGDKILVREGERIPVDGMLAEDECTVDEAVVTGESLPVLKQAGDDVVGGAVVTNGAAVLTVSDSASSSIDRLITSVWNLQSGNHGVQRQADRLASFAIPFVVGGSVLAGGWSLVRGSGILIAVLTTLSVLFVGGPWALGLATPLSVATSIEEAVNRGIVVFDETVFERLRNVDVVVFDKTGTITTGRMEVLEVDAPADLLEVVADLERRASHPAADAIVTAFAQQDRDGELSKSDGGVADQRVPEKAERVIEFTSHASGVEGVVEDTRVLVGNHDLFAELEWSVSDAIETRATEARDAGQLPVIVGRDGRAEGVIVVGDEPRAGWDDTLTQLSDRDIEIVVLTGDDEAATEFLGEHPAVDHVFAGVPPAGKTATIRRLQSRGQVTMVGDGTNDAPALATADLGISLGGGTALASDAADISIVDDDLSAVGTTFDLADAARRRVRQNNAVAVLYNVVTIPLAVVGLLNPVFAMGAVVTSGGLLAANSFRDLIGE
ncbi:heavy metal translocating P-type ATPase [Halorarius litoreus]|jgi:heavy metal translocating P-type ATPase|uniref:heavy metal translocating P-type ATPase n=1 Tax=Halorarius litoreus TaxID=2962676 RepID=UPI0020CDD0DF|nr:cation-translocating P-type ATPase [Halorarius litoreus]